MCFFVGNIIMYKFLILSGLVAVCSLRDLSAMNGESGELNVLSNGAKNHLFFFLDPNILKEQKESVGLVAPFDSDFCEEMAQRISADDIQATEWVIAENFLFDVLRIQKREAENKDYRVAEKLKVYRVAEKLKDYQDRFGKEFTKDIFNYYMQDPSIKICYNSMKFFSGLGSRDYAFNAMIYA